MIDDKRLAEIEAQPTMYDAQTICDLVAEVQRLRAAMKSALEPLGTGQCACEGCECEAGMAVDILTKALQG